jgi:hypothetical protein
VTYGIIQEHKGSIEVTSRQGGTRFHLELPWSKAVHRVASRAAGAPASGIDPAPRKPVNAA